MQKPGYKTTEFWVTLLAVVGGTITALSTKVPDRYAGWVAAIASAAYAVSRGLAKLTLPPPSE